MSALAIAVSATFGMVHGHTLQIDLYPNMPNGVPRPLFPAICFIIF